MKTGKEYVDDAERTFANLVAEQEGRDWYERVKNAVTPALIALLANNALLTDHVVELSARVKQLEGN